MQNAALRAVGLGEDWHYGLLPVVPERFEEVVSALPGAGFRGANVTIPHKAAALRLATEATGRARAIGAANTLVFEPDGIHADNTDAPALIAALPFAVRGRTALVLGAGGSARAAVWALLDAGAAEVRVWNRTAERARGLAAELGAVPVTGAEPADLLVHCTSNGLLESDRTFKQLPLEADELGRYDCVVDFVYSDTETELARCARSLAVPVVDGLELLVGQGALSFQRFTGLNAPVDAMRAAVRAT
jgi:shikimate dehydrogenase